MVMLHLVRDLVNFIAGLCFWFCEGLDFELTEKRKNAAWAKDSFGSWNQY